MALTFPTPPTPPAPPKAPKVVLEGGGSVTEMPRPKSYGPKSDSEINEQKAKDAVAKGSGPLSKTTVQKDDSRNTKVEGKTNPAADAKTANDANTASVPAPQKSTNAEKSADTKEKYLDLKEFEGDKGQTQNQALTQSRPFSVRETDSHGVLYWGFTIISVLALLVYLAKKFLINNSNTAYSFSKRDLSYLTEETPSVTPSPLQTTPKQPPTAIKNYETQKNIKPKRQETKIKESSPLEAKREEPKREGVHFEARV